MNAFASTLTSALRPAQHSETLLINEVSARLQHDGRPLYRFGFGQSPFPVPAQVVSQLQRFADCKGYTPVQGLPELRQAIAGFHRLIDGFDWSADRILIGPGSKMLIYCLMAAFRRADVALVTPSWVSYEPQARLAGHRVYRLPTDFSSQWTLRPEQLQAFCEQRRDPHRPLLLILNSPGNPNGMSYPAQQLQALAEVLRQQQVLVLSDEIYAPLHHRGEHVSISHYYPEGTIVSTGLSKWCGAGGWRLGALHLPPSLGEGLMQRLIGVASETYSCVAEPIQRAAISAYQADPATLDYIAHQRRLLGVLGRDCAERLRAVGVQVNNPDGGFYLFPEFERFRARLKKHGIGNGEQLTRALLEQARVALLPGSAFGLPRRSLTARLAYVDFDGTRALQDEHPDFSHVLAGIDALCSWLESL